ncbi:hypothetical protein PIB30_079309 [Stylosanthes scabra]|uniref:Uncharacterized protein n=1 Tax=Stylosanthes scabra TaxID=79078 RepID=A0ABU6YPX1_9FABA|nr:hypothetical protein [Stylosanthes scabra]
MKSGRKAHKPPGTHPKIALQAWSKELKLSSGAMLLTGPEAHSLENKAINEWPTRKNGSSKPGKIRYNLDRSHEDLNHPKLYKQGASPPQGLFLHISTSFSVIALGYAGELNARRHIC